MAQYIDEFAVKVSADTSSFTSKLTKELKKLKQDIHRYFTSNDIKQDIQKLSHEMSLAFDPDKGGWTKGFTKYVNKTLKGVRKEAKKTIKELRGKNWGGYNNVRDLLIDGYKGSIKKAKRLQKKGIGSDPDTYSKLALNYEYGEDMTKAWKNDKLKTNFLKEYGYEEASEITERIAYLEDRITNSIKNGHAPSGERVKNLKAEKEYLSSVLADYQAFVKKARLGADANSEEKKKFEEMSKRYEELKKEAKDTGKKEGIFKTIWKKIAELPKMIGRIFTRYLGYQLIKNFFGQLEQGMQNLYVWSRYNKKEWSDIFDKSKSMSTALGNAIAVLRTYATLWFMKIGDSFKELFIDLANVLSKTIAFITGQKTYVQANKDIMIRWSDNNAQTRQLIQGFDRLNIWKGSDNTLPQNMFTEYEFGSDYNAGNIWSIIVDFFKGPFLTSLKTIVQVLWGSVIKPTIASLFGIQILAGQDSVTLLKAIWDKVKTWWNGVTDEDEGDNGETITRVVEPGFKHALQEWFSETGTKIKQWFVGDESRGTEGVWQKNIKPAFDGLFTKFSSWMQNTFVPLIANIWNNSELKKAVDTEKDTLADIGYSIANVLPWNWWKIQNGERPLVRPNAKGGVYTTPALGLVGEASTRNNPEIITPQALLDERLQANNQALLGAFNSIANNIIGAINNVNMEVSIGDDVIAKSAARGNNAYYRMMGRPLIR